MDGFIKLGVAHTFRLGPFLDDTDGKTAETGLTIAYTDVFLSKNGAAFAAKAETTNLTGTGDARGYYTCIMNTTDTGTVGTLKVCAAISGALPVWQTFQIVPAVIFDSLFAAAGTDYLPVDVMNWNNAALTSPDTAGSPKVTITAGTGAGQIDFTSGVPKANITLCNGNAVAAGAIPNVAAGGSGGLLISGSNTGTTTFAVLTVTGAMTISDGLIVNRSSANQNAVTLTGNGTGHGLAALSGTGATGDGIRATSQATNGNGLTGVHAGSGYDFNMTNTPLALAKTTNITGFNDILATAIVSSGAITTSGGAVSTVTNVTTVATATNVTTVNALAANVITAASINTGAITNAKFAAGAIDAAAIADNAIDLATFAADAKTGSALKANVETITANAITAASINTGAITNAKFAAGAIDAAAIATGAIDNDALAADISTLDNRISAAVWNTLNKAFSDADSPTSNGLVERMRVLGWILRNKIEVADSTGNTVIYKDDNATTAFSVSAMLTDNSTTTTRLRAA